MKRFSTLGHDFGVSLIDIEIIPQIKTWGGQIAGQGALITQRIHPCAELGSPNPGVKSEDRQRYALYAARYREMPGRCGLIQGFSFR